MSTRTVPLEPTEEMIQAIIHALDGVNLSKMGRHERARYKAIARHKAMIAAATNAVEQTPAGETPRTSALAKKHSDALEPTPECDVCEPLADNYYELFQHSSQLERDLAASQERVRELEGRLSAITNAGHDETCGGMDEAHNRCACGWLQKTGAHQYIMGIEDGAMAAGQRAEKAEQERDALAKDAKYWRYWSAHHPMAILVPLFGNNAPLSTSLKDAEQKLDHIISGRDAT